MKNSKTILKNIVSCLPVELQNDALEILTCRYLALNSAQETACILGLPVVQVVNTMQEVKKACKGKGPADFIKA